MPYADDELGVDDAASFELSLVFDDQLHVVLGGFTGWDGANPAFAIGNGLDIAALVTALDADYQAAIMQPYLAGTGSARRPSRVPARWSTRTTARRRCCSRAWWVSTTRRSTRAAATSSAASRWWSRAAR